MVVLQVPNECWLEPILGELQLLDLADGRHLHAVGEGWHRGGHPVGTQLDDHRPDPFDLDGGPRMA